MKPYFVFNSRLPKRFGVDGITLFPVIFFAATETEARATGLIEHEMVHAKQIGEIGLVRFYLSYILYFWAGYIRTKDRFLAYKSIPFEDEAYTVQESFLSTKGKA